MSSHSSHIDPEPSDNKALFSALGWLGVMFMFILIVAVAYLGKRPTSVDAKQAEQRHAIRAESEALQTRLVNSYDWINRDNGVVRIPVERAMELTLRDLRTVTPEGGAE
jgi:flagellar basal body-associated protein FliL